MPALQEPPRKKRRLQRGLKPRSPEPLQEELCHRQTAHEATEAPNEGTGVQQLIRRATDQLREPVSNPPAAHKRTEAPREQLTVRQPAQQSIRAPQECANSLRRSQEPTEEPYRSTDHDSKAGQQQTIQPERPANTKDTVKLHTFNCQWQQCEARLHNLKTLQLHLTTMHCRQVSDPPRYECRWRGCDEPVFNSLHQSSSRHCSFTTTDEWHEHVWHTHISDIAWALGDGPTDGLRPTSRPDSPSLHYPPAEILQRKARESEEQASLFPAGRWNLELMDDEDFIEVIEESDDGLSLSNI